MPLSKAKMRDRKRLDRLAVKPNLTVVKPKLPWYAGASDHFGQITSKHYAMQFLNNL